jgi:hypothetical protein
MTTRKSIPVIAITESGPICRSFVTIGRSLRTSKHMTILEIKIAEMIIPDGVAAISFIGVLINALTPTTARNIATTRLVVVQTETVFVDFSGATVGKGEGEGLKVNLHALTGHIMSVNV